MIRSLFIVLVLAATAHAQGQLVKMTPVAKIAGNDTGIAGTLITLDGSTSDFVADDPRAWMWIVKPGTFKPVVAQDGKSITIANPVPGQYTIELIVGGPTGLVARQEFLLTLIPYTGEGAQQQSQPPKTGAQFTTLKSPTNYRLFAGQYFDKIDSATRVAEARQVADAFRAGASMARGGTLTSRKQMFQYINGTLGRNLTAGYKQWQDVFLKPLSAALDSEPNDLPALASICNEIANGLEEKLQ